MSQAGRKNKIEKLGTETNTTVNTEETKLIPKETNISSSNKDTTEENSNSNSTIIVEIDTELSNKLTSFDYGCVIKKESSKKITKEQVNKIINMIAKTHDISFTQAAGAISLLFKKGAANAGAADSLSVEINTPELGQATEVTKYAIKFAIQTICNHTNIRKLAETMAPEMIEANLNQIQKNPLLDLKGDLANRINKNLIIQKEPALTRKEEVCCCTYAQWMPNLNELADSTRLKSLLEQDLQIRANAKKNKKKNNITQKNPTQNKGYNTTKGKNNTQNKKN